MKGVVDRLFARQNPGAMLLSRPGPARPTWRSPAREAASGRERADDASPPVDLVNRLEAEARAGCPIHLHRPHQQNESPEYHADTPHLPYNLSETEPAIAVVARTDPNEQEGVVMLPKLDGLHA
jgi:hypothetical protein